MGEGGVKQLPTGVVASDFLKLVLSGYVASTDLVCDNHGLGWGMGKVVAAVIFGQAELAWPPQLRSG